ncbi:APC family permease [Komagataeibacter swingsii]|uniref:Amino acid transporter n=1 Tax=Komagataeibacter swingsii TaxID=215220 RepID=A0A2V4RF12_9PROT|nr:APC family permease [Komagataeibacter swingsii]PYD68596.1 amino acid transporter [Komagataeibacter swingsii]GBQ57755.1 amino acid transporter [Komagataeibacter swingsii DSM 16373]
MNVRAAATAAGATRGPAGTGRLSGNLGAAEIIFMVIAAAAPLTVISGNVPLAITQGNGPLAWTGFVAAAAVMLLFSVGFVAMTAYMTEAGAFFTYIRAGLGARCGRAGAFLALLTYTAIQLGVYGFFGWSMDDAARQWGGPALPWWLYAAGVLGVVAVMGYRHIDLSSRVLGVALVLEIGVVVVMNAMILWRPMPVAPMAMTPVADAGPAGPFAVALLFAMTGFIGFEATAIFRDEARDPQRTIPRATYGAVVIIGLFYAISCWCVIHAWGADSIAAITRGFLDHGRNIVLETAGRYAGRVMQQAMQVLLLTSLFACLLSFHNIIARYQLALGREGIMPAFLARTHDRHASPHVASVAQTGTACVLLVLAALSGVDPLVDIFGSMAGISTIGITVLMVLTSVAVVAFFTRRRDLSRGRAVSTLAIPGIAAVALCAVLYIIMANFTRITGLADRTSLMLAVLPFAVTGLGFCVGRTTTD